MYADRLEMLAEKHEYDHVMQERFDYSRWVGQDWKGMQDLSCGTRACSMGFAATMPVFQALGLSLKMFHDPFDRQYGIITLTTADDIYEREMRLPNSSVLLPIKPETCSFSVSG